MAKKKGSTPSTPRKDDQPWELKPASAKAKSEWDAAKASEPDLMENVHERLCTRPLDRGDNPRRTHQLKGPLAFKWVEEKKLPQWQHEITGGGRVWYCPDRSTHIVWLVKATLSHPHETD